MYGGGGIIPDVFVPSDLSEENETLIYVLRSGFLSYFIFEHLDYVENRKVFNGVTANIFVDNYEVSDDLVEEFLEYSRLNETTLDLSSHGELMKKYLKATLAQQLFGSHYYEQIININDPMLLKVLELEYNEN